MEEYFDRDGKLIPAEKCKELSKDEDYRTIARDHRYGYLISTVWLPWCDDLDELFETMIFKDKSWSDIYRRQHSTLKDAKEGHEKALEWLKRYERK